MKHISATPVRKLFARFIGIGAVSFCLASTAFGINPDTIKPYGYHLSPLKSWHAPYFANALYNANTNWFDTSVNQHLFREAFGGSPVIGRDGYPSNLAPGQVLKTTVLTLPENPTGTWPDRNKLVQGQVVLEWKGLADVQLRGGSFVASKSPAGKSGAVRNGRRVYRYSGNQKIHLWVYEATSLTDIKVWLPDPTDPENRSLEGQLFHPELLARIADRNWNTIRFMGWNETNDNPMVNWTDRRRPDDAFMSGVLNRRAPSATDAPDMETGVAFEFMVALANETNTDLWINVPHMANNGFIDKLARLIAFGSDGVEPYDGPVGNPVYPPLNPGLRVWVEYSNEVWNGSPDFGQHRWLEAQAAAEGVSFEAKLAERFSKSWESFESHLPASRVVRVLATQGSNAGYTEKLVNAFNNQPALLFPEVLAVATYFGNSIQNWVADPVSGILLPSSDDPTTEPYWTSSQLSVDLDTMFAQWERYILSGRAFDSGTGIDSVDQPGGFDASVKGIANENNLILLAYEGGPNTFTSKLDGSSEGKRDDGITNFMAEAHRDPEIQSIYRIHMNLALSQGLRSGMMFQDVSKWSKGGMWGHLEYLGQDPQDSPKYQTVLEHYDFAETLNDPDRPVNQSPVFSMPAELPSVEVGTSFQCALDVSGGDFPVAVDLLGQSLLGGVNYDYQTGTLSGTPTEPGTSYVYLRAIDSDGDPAWRIFSLPAVERSTDPSASFNFEDESVVDDPAAPGADQIPPLQLGDYQFSSTNGNGKGLSFRDDTANGQNGWTSVVLFQRIKTSGIRIERTDQRTFDLTRLDVSSDQARSVSITSVFPDGTSQRQVWHIPTGKTSVTTITPNFIGRAAYIVQFHSDEEGNQNDATGAIDNLSINDHGDAGGQLVTLDFDSLDVGSVGPVLVDQGFQIECFTGASGVRDIVVFDGGPTRSIRPQGWGMRLELTRSGGAPFSINSFDHGAVNSNARQSLYVTGEFVGGSTRQVGPLTNTTFGSNLTEILDWTGLVRVTFDYKPGSNTVYGFIDAIELELP